MDALFEVHRLNHVGMVKAQAIAQAFDDLLNHVKSLSGEDHPPIPHSREFNVVRTKLEEAAFFAKKAMAKKPENQEAAV